MEAVQCPDGVEREIFETMGHTRRDQQVVP